MNIFHCIKKGIPIQYNNFIAVTPVPGLKFTNWYEKKGSFFFWHVVLNFGLLVALAVNVKFWYQYQFLSFSTVYEDFEQGVELAFPAIYLCPRHSLDPNKLAKYRINFLQPNFTMTTEAIDFNLQHMFRTQRAALNMSFKISPSLKDNVDMVWLAKNLDKLFYQVDDQFKDCSFQGLHRQCKEIFKSKETAIGRCFVFNSIYTDRSVHEDPHQVWYSNISESDEDWSLRFKIFRGSGTFVMIYLKHPTSLLSLNDFPMYTWYPLKQISDYDFALSEHFTDSSCRTLALGYRPCYFPDDEFVHPDLRTEFDTHFFDVGICLNHCHARKFMELCSCWPSFAKTVFPKMANKSRNCGIKDMECYEKHYLAVRQMKCSECRGNCNGILYHRDTNTEDVQKDDIYPGLNSSLDIDYSELNIQLVYWPRLHLNVINIFSTTEFIRNVAVASTACLFLGTSILTCMEVFYNLFIRFPLFYFINREYFVTTNGKQQELERQKLLPCINLRLKPGLHKHQSSN